MGKWHGKKQALRYTSPFQSPRANPKHAYKQINGETQQTMQDQLREVRERQHNMYLQQKEEPKIGSFFFLKIKRHYNQYLIK